MTCTYIQYEQIVASITNYDPCSHSAIARPSLPP